jgi:hypothetical protein
VELAATVTEDGVVNKELLSERLTVVLLDGACESVTVHVEVPPDGTEVGEHCNDVIVGVADGVRLTEVVAELPFSVAVSATV